MADHNSKPSSTAQASFEEAVAALEQIVADLETGRLGLAESLARYEEGVKLLKQCYIQLEQAERRIELLTGIDAAGNPVVQPFDDDATLSESQPTALPRGRRSGKSSKKVAVEANTEDSPPPPAMDEQGGLF